MVIGDFGNIYLSIFKHIKEYLTSEGFIVSGHNTGVTLLDAYPDDDQLKKVTMRADATGDSDEIVLPIMTIEPSSINTNDYELGSNSKYVENRILITIFAETNIQRYQLLNAIVKSVKDRDVAFYNFDDDFLNPTSGTSLAITNMSAIPTNFVGSPNPVLKWGADVSFVVSKRIA